MKNRFFVITLAILTMGLFVTSNVRAQDEPQPQAPPQAQAQTAVGRISVIHGNVSIVHGDAGVSVAGTVNTPVVPGDKLATADGSRAEVQLDFANIMRLDPGTEATVADLEQNKINIQLSSGLVNFSVLNGTQADVEIDTPNMGVHPLKPGVYRIQVNSPSETQLIVRQGEAEVLTNQGSTKVEAGQIIQIRGTDNPEYNVGQAPGGDDFDKWCLDRDRQIQSAQASQHADPTYIGSSDLDANGQWSEVPDQGWCWTPQVDAGWVPYSAGNWGWEPYWGWTWISYEPWGWAPYHSGNWFMYGGRWRWRPDRGGWGGRDGRGGWGGRGGNQSGNRWGGASGNRFLPRGGGVSGRPGANMPSFGSRSGSMGTGRGQTGRMGARGSTNSWQGFSRGNPSSRWPTPVSGGSRGSGPSTSRGGWQGYSGPPRSYSGGGMAGRPYSGSRGWNAPAPRSGGSYYGGGSRPPLNLNRPIMQPRAPRGGYYGGGRSYSGPSGGGRSYSPPSGGGRGYSAPSGGGRGYSAPSGGGGRGYSAPRGGGGGGGGRSSGGGGGGRSSGGGGGHSSGGGGGHGGGRH